MDINFIITAHNKEDFLPYLVKVLQSYKKIRPNPIVCYNGYRSDFPCTIRMTNSGHQRGDKELTLAGYRWHQQNNTCLRYIKIGIDSWLLDEDAIITIFEDMDKAEACYGGNRWEREDKPLLATDIIFADLHHGDPFIEFAEDGPSFEWWMYEALKRRRLKTHMIWQRIPVHPDNRHVCGPLKWTMEHDLQKNIENAKKWGYCL